jgi:transposase
MSKKTRDKTTFRRCQVVLRAANGESGAAIATALACHPSIVSRMAKAFREQGEASLNGKKSPGRPRKVTPEQAQALNDLVAQEPRELGKNLSNWTSKTLGEHLGLNVHPTTVQRHLRRMGWRWRRPRHRIASPDPRYMPKKRYLRRLEGKARRGEIHLYYADEVDIDLLPTLSGRWMRVGQQHQVDTPGQNEKHYGFGAVNAVTGFLAWLTWPNKNNVGFRHLLRLVLDHHALDTLKIVIVVDNYRIHKANAVKQMLAALKGRLRLYFLPTYSPHLNPLERLWRFFRDRVTSNYYFKTMSRLLKAAEAFFAELVDTPEVVLSVIAVA